MGVTKIAPMGQIWRVSRLFGVSFAHAAWIGALGLDWPSRTALMGIAIGASEGAYRAVFPAGNKRTIDVLHELSSIVSNATSTTTTVNATNATVTPTDDGKSLVVNTSSDETPNVER